MLCALHLYDGLPSDVIDHLRYSIFKKKVSNASITKSISKKDLLNFTVDLLPYWH